jgi:hypothetical protein
MAFHENAGGCQVNCDFVFDFVFVFAFLRFTFLPSGEILQSSPERSRARLGLGAAQRTLDGEDCSAILRLGRKVSILSSASSSYFVSPLALCDLPAPGSPYYCRHPSIRTRIELFLSLGASWVFSFSAGAAT